MKKVAPKLEHPFPFDPTYGYHLDALLSVPLPEEPADFSQFWQDTYAETLATPLRLTSRKVISPRPEYSLYEIEYDSLDGVRIGAWVTVPKTEDQRGGWVVYHGYGGRGEPDFDLPRPAGPAIFPCARGFNRSAQADIPGEAAGHVVHGIDSRETYVHRGCAADAWQAASALIEMFPSTAKDLRYMGGSFGGGMGALAVPWEPRFHRAYLDIPSFGNHPLRVTVPCVGSGAAVREYWLRRPEVMNVLAYFDAATAARNIRIPAFVSPALFDPAVPPQGQFSIYNAIPGPKDLYVRSAAHFACRYEITEGQELHALLDQWFSEGSGAA